MREDDCKERPTASPIGEPGLEANGRYAPSPDGTTRLASDPVLSRPPDEVAAWLHRVTLN